MKHMAWGAAKRLFQMAPPVAMARQIAHNFDIAEMAVKQAQNGDWDLAGNTILEIPQEAAESAARILCQPHLCGDGRPCRRADRHGPAGGP